MSHDASPSAHSPDNGAPPAGARELTRLIDQLAHLLPAQGPISIFIHHNTLHSFEHLLFEQAVERAAVQLGREPFLAEARYRDKLASGRIRAGDIDALLREELGDAARQDVAGVGPRLDLWRAMVLHGIPHATGRELSWILEETDVLSRFRTDLPAQARSASSAPLNLSKAMSTRRRAGRSMGPLQHNRTSEWLKGGRFSCRALNVAAIESRVPVARSKMNPSSDLAQGS